MIVNGVLVELTARPDSSGELDEILERVLRLADDEVQSELNVLLVADDHTRTVLHFFMDPVARAEHMAGPASQAIAYSARLLEDEPLVVEFDLPVDVAAELEQHVGRHGIVIDLRTCGEPLTTTG
ncbi:MAG: hypothetical protein U0Q22_08965 [Acidimicrobiales bacterium]